MSTASKPHPTSTARRRPLLGRAAVLAAAGLLTLAACGGAEQTPEQTPTSAPAQSDGGGQALPTSDSTASEGTSPSESPSATASDGGGAASQDPAAAPLGDGVVIDGEEPQGADLALEGMIFLPGLSADSVPAVELEDQLTARLGGEASCEGALDVTAAGWYVTCQAPAGMESTETVTWTAVSISSAADGPTGASGHAALFVRGGEDVGMAAADAFAEDLRWTGLGQGSMFGVDGVPKADLEAATLSTLNAENSYAPIGTAWDGTPFTRVTCEGDLDMTVLSAVPCSAETETGQYWVAVLPGPFVDSDRGLLVGVLP